MPDLMIAEWRKLLPHKGTWFLIWLYPLGVLLLLTIALGVRMVNGGEAGPPGTAEDWIAQTTVIWNLPRVGIGRFLIAAYVVLVFAGEYGWNTWKLVVPHSARWKLVAAKYAVTLALLYLAWAAAAAITVAGALLAKSVSGGPMPEGVTLAAVLQGHLDVLVLGIAPLLLTLAYASLAAVLTRSMLAGSIIAMVLITIDQLFGRIAIFLSLYGFGWVKSLYSVLPSYHLENLSSWMQEGVGYQARFPDGGVVAFSQSGSLAALGLWIAGLAALSFVTFRRQDIN